MDHSNQKFNNSLKKKKREIKLPFVAYSEIATNVAINLNSKTLF